MTSTSALFVSPIPKPPSILSISRCLRLCAFVPIPVAPFPHLRHGILPPSLAHPSPHNRAVHPPAQPPPTQLGPPQCLCSKFVCISHPPVLGPVPLSRSRGCWAGCPGVCARPPPGDKGARRVDHVHRHATLPPGSRGAAPWKSRRRSDWQEHSRLLVPSLAWLPQDPLPESMTVHTIRRDSGRAQGCGPPTEDGVVLG